MSIVFSNGLALTDDESDLTLDHPVIGWQNVATIDSIVATAADAEHPVSNLVNPATHLWWQTGTSGVIEINVTTNTADDIDYLALVRHNLGSSAAIVQVGYYDTSSPAAFIALTSAQVLADDSPVIFRWTAQPLTNIVLRITAVNVGSRIAVLYVGKLLVLPRKVYQGLVPINYARTAKVTNGKSEAGNFLGRIVMQEYVDTTLPLSLIDPTYYRDHIDAFLDVAQEIPFFIAWRPETYPMEVGYCFMKNNPAPLNQAPHGLISMTLDMTGVV